MHDPFQYHYNFHHFTRIITRQVVSEGDPQENSENTANITTLIQEETQSTVNLIFGILIGNYMLKLSKSPNKHTDIWNIIFEPVGLW